jgi:mRNA interferase MazF
MLIAPQQLSIHRDDDRAGGHQDRGRGRWKKNALLVQRLATGGGRIILRGPARAHMKTNVEAPTDTRSEKINRGDVFWMRSEDARGPDPSYSHPHVVVQEDVFNHSRISTVVVCAMTSNLDRVSEPGNVLLDAGEGNLPKQSVVVVSQVSSVDKVRLGERIGSLSEARVDQIVAGLRFQQVSFFQR